MPRNQEPGTIVHKECGTPMKVEVLTHNAAPGERATAVHYICESCAETYKQPK